MFVSLVSLVSTEASTPKNNSQIGRFRACLTCLSGLHGGFQVKKQPNWSVLCLSHLSHLSQCLKGTSLPLKKTACLHGRKKTVKNGWFRVCLTCLRCCIDCLNSRFHAARRPKWPVSCLSQLHQLSQHKVSCSKTIKKMDVLWSQIVSIAGFMQKKSKKIAGFVLSHLSHLSHLSQ